MKLRCITVSLALGLFLAACNNSKDNPVVHDDIPSSVRTLEDQPVTFQVFRNRDEILQVADFQKPANGELHDNGDASFTFQPRENFNGEDGLLYVLTNGEERLIQIVVNAANDPPFALDDVAVTRQNQAVVFDPLDNDVDVESSPLRVTAIGTPGNGTIEQADGAYRYTPNDGFSGEEQMTYTVSDGGDESQGTIHLFVFGPQFYVTNMRIEPGNPRLTIDDIAQFKAIVQLNDGTEMDVTNAVTWRILEPSDLVAVAQAQPGKFRAAIIGVTEIRANYNSFTASTQVSINGHVPLKPSGLVAVAGVEKVILDWGPVAGVERYNVYVSANNSGNTVIPNVFPPFVHSALQNSTHYRYQVSALNAFGESELSEWAWVTTLAPQTVSMGAGAESQTGQVNVTWTTQPGFTYQVEWSDRALLANSPAVLGTQNNANPPFVFADGAHGRMYYFRIHAIDQGQRVVATEIVSAVFERQAPPQPTIARIDTFDGELRVFFSQDSKYHYQLHWVEGQVFDLQHSVEIDNVTSPYIHARLTNGLTYHYVLTARDDFQMTSPFSNTASASPQAPVGNRIPEAKNVSIADNNQGDVVVGVTLSAAYEYSDADGDEQEFNLTLYQWYRGATPIDDATFANYTLVAQDSGQNIHYTVSPIAVAGANPGLEMTSPSVTVVNSPPTADNLGAPETLTEDAPAFALATIVINEPDQDLVTATLSLSDGYAGVLTTATVGAAVSTFAGGIWRASGPVADVNGLLAQVQFAVAPNYDRHFSIATSVSDGVNPAIQGTKLVDVTAVNDAPNGVIATITGSYAVGDRLTLDGSLSSDIEGNTPFAYQWVISNTGNGGTSTITATGPTPAITFTQAGEHTVTLTVADSLGLADPTPATVKLAVVFVQDITPDAFTFNGKIDAPTGIWIDSNPIAVVGINSPSPLSISGGRFSIDGGAFTGVAATVNAGQQVTVQLLAPPNAQQTANAILTIGGVSGTFSVTTTANPCVAGGITASTGTQPGAIDVNVNAGSAGCVVAWQSLQLRRNPAGLAPKNCYDGVLVQTLAALSPRQFSDNTGFPGQHYGYRLCEIYNTGLIKGDHTAINVPAGSDPRMQLHIGGEVNGNWPNANFVEDLPMDGQALGAAVLPDGTSYVVGYQVALVHSTSQSDMWIRKFGPTGNELFPGWNKQINRFGGTDRATDVEVNNLGSVFVLGTSAPAVVTARTIILSYDAAGAERLGGWPKTMDYKVIESYQDKLYAVAGNGGQSVLVAYADDGSELFSTPLGLASGTPQALFIDKTGIIFVGGTTTIDTATKGFVKRFNANGIELGSGWMVEFTPNTPLPGPISVFAIAEDITGNVYVGGGVGSAYNLDYYVKKFSSIGVEDTVNWGQLMDPGAWEYAIDALVVDSQDHIYAAGVAFQQLMIKKFQTDGTEITTGWNKITGYPVTGNSYSHVALALMPDESILVGIPGSTDDWVRNYSADGIQAPGWVVNHSKYGGSDKINSIALDSGGTVYVGGHTTLREIWSGSYPVIRDAGFVAKLDAQASPTLLWQENPFYGEGVKAIVTDSRGALYNLGFSYGNSLRKIDPVLGTVIWTQSQSATAGNPGEGSSLTIDTCDNPYFSQLNQNVFSATSGMDWSILKISPGGVYDTTWRVNYDTEIPRVLRMDGINGGLFILGNNNADWWMQKFDANGTCAVGGTPNAVWSKQFSPGAGGVIHAAALDQSGALYAVGNSGNNWRIKKYAPDGSEVTVGWDKTIAAGYNDAAFAVAIDTTHVYVAGSRTNMVASDSSQDIYIVKYSLDGVETTGGGWPLVYDGGFRGSDVVTSLVMDGTSLLVGGYVQQQVGSDTGRDYFLMRLSLVP